MDDIHVFVGDHRTSIQTVKSTIGGVISHDGGAVDIPIDSHGNLEAEYTETSGAVDEHKLSREVRHGFGTGLEAKDTGAISNMCCTESSVVPSSESVEGATTKEDLPNPPISTPVRTTTTTTNNPTYPMCPIYPIYRNITLPPPISLDDATQSRINKKFQTAIKETPTIRLIVDIPPHLGTGRTP
ncbi:hypothetical protein PENNAL_c0048G07856 [Penicillium nalgiovense]|uniref:Uncharacterized protein n=1 Tax=Penicillium nalgiovense TaxID=60175 RepID=A0A1V6XY82_PENNA|nr:hypothetical protein PENNAL_c0048G07856 [Penicillium nalgiovense]